MAYNILIVDDSSVVRKMLIRTFAMTELTVGKFIEASNGQEGIKALSENWVDLVLLDINMPVMNGIEFMHQIRGQKETEQTKVIVVSTEGSNDRILELKSLGVEEYLRKPVTPEALVETLQRVLGSIEDG